MIRPREHSAQVPTAEREALERWFKGNSEIVNTLVCTPTLEMGVDIGALDVVLMRNVPPLPANYWQRAGRAGRRHRMAVNVTYARATSHDQAYFSEPMKILQGLVEPPRFNLGNELMVAKHVHAAVLTRLHQLERENGTRPQEVCVQISETLKRVFPAQIRDYLFDETGLVRSEVFDVSPLSGLIEQFFADLFQSVQVIFSQGWPVSDHQVVEPQRLTGHIRGMTDNLQGVVRALRKRLHWALDQMRRLDESRRLKGTLDPDEDAHYQRCDRLVKRYKGQLARRRREAQGYDDINTYNVLAAEGFLPGYGLEIGSINATGSLTNNFSGSGDFDLPRPPAVALREYVPGNLIYANGHRFTPRFFQIQGVEQPLLFQVDLTTRSIVELGIQAQNKNDPAVTAVSLTSSRIQAIPVCDVSLSHLSHITDDEEYRFQLPVAVLGYERGRHDGGAVFHWGSREMWLRHNVHFRLVNVGAASMFNEAKLGYPLCFVCGQSRSPFSSETEITKFRVSHQERCGKPAETIGFFTDVVADTLVIPGCASQEEAYSLAEGLRTGAARVLEMEREDLDILVMPNPTTQEIEAWLYDPMPGGSGLLKQICDRFSEVVTACREIAETCPSCCRRACIDCFYTFRNAFFHKHLDRFFLLRTIDTQGVTLSFAHDIPPKLPLTVPQGIHQPVNQAEATLRKMMLRAGFPEPQWQVAIALGKPLGSTTPDCFFPGEDDLDPGVCIYLDGLSDHIHGNSQTQTRDRAIREELRSRGYEVFEIAATELTDRLAMTRYFLRLGRTLLGKEAAQKIKTDSNWFDEKKENNPEPQQSTASIERERARKLVEEAREWDRQQQEAYERRMAAMTPEERAAYEKAIQPLLDRMASSVVDPEHSRKYFNGDPEEKPE